MNLAGQILVGFLTLVGLVTVVRLGSPRTYHDRGVAWYLSCTAWAGVLFDGVLVLTSFHLLGGPWAAIGILAGLSARGAVAVWLLAMIEQNRRRRP